MERKTYQLGDVVNCLDYKRVPLSSKVREDRKGIYPYYGAQGVVDYVDDFIFDGTYLLVAEDGENLRSQNEHIANLASGKYWVNNHAHILESNGKCDIRYICYYLNNLDIRGYITGSAQPKLNQDNLLSIRLLLPDLKEQTIIADVLDVLDKKIALNTRMNAELEAMAKQLYDYWFVQFDFPDENGHPYKSSGGKMVYNSTLKREIPAGWGDCEIKDIAEVVNGATPLTTNPDNYGNAIIWITPNDLSNQKSKFVSCGERSITQNGYDSCSTTLMPAGSVLMSSRAPIGLMAIAEVELCTNQGFKNFVPFDMTDNYFLYYYIKEHMAQIEQLGAGTTFREVSRDTMLKFPILKISDRGLYSKWYEQIDSICKEQKNLLLQIRHLTHLRDSLLPMLMNGQVTVE